MSASTRTLETGRVLGRYQLLDVVASGGMGCVWAARQLGAHRFQKMVAVKVSHPSLARQGDFRAMFLDEAALASAVQHPNVCSVLDLGEDGEALYLVLEWVNGASFGQLLSVLPRHRLSPRIAAWIVAEACAGLHSAHELRDQHGVLRDLVHRDVSPQNILLSADGHVKLADFGIARAKDQLHQVTETGQVKGKLSYMAPEQLRSRDYDRRVDVYALGCVLYTATVGKKAFAGEPSALYEILEGRFAPPSDVIADYPAELEAIVLRAMGPVAARFPTADDLRNALTGWLHEQPPCSPHEVASVLRNALGSELDQRARTLHDVAAQLDAMGSVDDGRGSSHPMVGGMEAGVDAEAETRSVVVTNVPSNTSTVIRGARPSRRLLLAAGALAVAGAALVVPFVAARTHERPRDAQGVLLAASTEPRLTPAATPSSVEAPRLRGDVITLALRVTPPDAVVTLDGESCANPLREDVAADGRSHVVQASAPGFVSERVTVVFDQPRDLGIDLLPTPHGRAPGAVTSAARPARVAPAPANAPAPTATATPTKTAVALPPTSKPIDIDDPFGKTD